MKSLSSFLVVVSAAYCAQLPGNYLPPKSTGAGNFLSSPDSYAPPPTGPVVRAFAGAPAGIPVAILRFDSNNEGDGKYNFEYETENGIVQQERGDNGVVIGSYSYKGPNGHTYTVHYIADENGFNPTGDHIPTTAEATTVNSFGTTQSAGNAPSSKYLPATVASNFDGYHY